MAPRYEIDLNERTRVISIRMEGTFDLDTMKAFCVEYEQATDKLAGAHHVVFADMRGMKPAFPEVAEVFGKSIGYARQHGVACCAHLSDDTVQRLQAARVARKNSPHDDVTVDVVSETEAQRVVAEAVDAIRKGDVDQVRAQL